MPESSRFGHLPWLLLSVLILVVDRVTKDIFEGTLSMYQRIEVIPGYFDWTLAYNCLLYTSQGTVSGLDA